jgi:hypothetical protein
MYLKLVVLFGQVGSNETGLVVRPMKVHVSEFIQSLRILDFLHVGLVVSSEKKNGLSSR